MKRSLIIAACMLFLTSPTYSQNPIGIDVNSLRDSVLGHAAAQLGSDALGLAHSALLPPEPTAAQTWGIEVMVVPDIFAKAVPELANGPGLLVTNVYPQSPADRLGMRKGMVLLEVDHRRLTKECELPKLDRTLAILALTGEGVRTAEIHPSPDWMSQLTNKYLEHGFNRRVAPVTPASATRRSCSVSMAEVNGKLAITAVIPTEHGDREVQLRGTRTEVETQLNSLPHGVQKTLRPQIGF